LGLKDGGRLDLGRRVIINKRLVRSPQPIPWWAEPQNSSHCAWFDWML